MVKNEPLILGNMQVDHDRKRRIWNQLESRLDDWCSTWLDHVNRTAVKPEVIARRRGGGRFSNEEVFEALVLAILSNQTDWRPIQRVRPELSERFDGFDIQAYAEKKDDELDGLVAWFKERKAGSQTRPNDLKRLRETAKKLRQFTSSGLDAFFQSCIEASGGKAESAVFALGGVPRWKLPGFGPALSAEALRNLGYDIAKPDRHVLRAVGQWDFVEFRCWPDRSGTNAPQPSKDELLLAMGAVSDFAKAINKTTTFTDSVIWTACAKGGAWLTNKELKALAN